MITERFGWARMDAGARRKAKNETKRTQNARERDVLLGMHTVQKNRRVTDTNMVTREDQGEQ